MQKYDEVIMCINKDLGGCDFMHLQSLYSPGNVSAWHGSAAGSIAASQGFSCSG